MRLILALTCLACLLVYCESSGTWPRRTWDPRSQQSSKSKSKSISDRFRNPYARCGGKGQLCCRNSPSPCGLGLECKVIGERNWFSAAGRCVPPKKHWRCGLEGMDCCRKAGNTLCARGLECAANMCRNPRSAVNIRPTGVAGQTTASVSGWIMVKVLARGGKCFVKVNGNLNTNIQSFGEGTFGEVFGSLEGVGECADGAQGFGVGYIRVESISTATLTEDGDCIAESNTTADGGTKIKGEGISIGIGGEAGSSASCNKGRRRLRVLDYIPI